MPRRRIWTVAATILWLLPSEGAAQAMSNEAGSGLPTGLRVEIEMSGNAARLDQGARAVFASAGSPSFGLGYGLVLGYDGRQAGFSMAAELGAVALDASEREAAGVVSFVAQVHWRPAWSWAGGSWPVLSVGYVRQGFGSVEVPVASLPAEAAELAGTRDEVQPALIGNGVRVGAGSGWRWGRTLALTADLSVDLVRYGSLSVEGGEVSRADVGTSVLPRLGIGLAWWPF